MKSAGQFVADAHVYHAGDAGGQGVHETQPGHAARKKSAGPARTDAQDVRAGDAGGHNVREAQERIAARKNNADPATNETPRSSVSAGADLGQNMPATQSSIAEVRADLDHQGMSHAELRAKLIAAAARDGLIDQIIELGRTDAFAIRQRMRVRQSTLSHLARALFGYRTDLPEDERAKAMKAATKLIKDIQGGAQHPASALVMATDAAAAPWEDIERETERAMVKLTRKLPAYAWAKSVRGFGDLSFARIIAETGDLANYATPAKVWKRMGLAVIDGQSQRKSRDKDKAAEQGYSPYRRAVMFVAFEPVLKAQSAPKENGGQSAAEVQLDVAAEAIGAGQLAGDAQSSFAGPYRLLYDAKKLEYLARGEAGEKEWTKLHSHRAAMRYASKRLLRDLWIEWRRDCRPGA